MFYELIKKEVVGDLKTYTDLMVDSDAWKIVTDPDNNSMESALQNNNSHLRITFVDASGKLYMIQMQMSVYGKSQEAVQRLRKHLKMAVVRQ